jgi:hypothetical protein
MSGVNVICASTVAICILLSSMTAYASSRTIMGTLVGAGVGAIAGGVILLVITFF